MDNARSNERDDSLYSHCRDPHIRMAICSIGIFAYRRDRDIRVSHFPFLYPNVGLLISSIDFVPGYSSPFLPTRSWRWANPGTWVDELGCSWVFRPLGLWRGLRFPARLNRRLETLELLVIAQVSSRFCRPCWALRSIHFRNCYPHWGWYVVVYTPSCFAKDVWKDMISMDEVDETL